MGSVFHYGEMVPLWFATLLVMVLQKNTELGSSDQDTSPSASKNTEVVLVPCHA